jgi:hypothetical protein
MLLFGTAQGDINLEASEISKIKAIFRLCPSMSLSQKCNEGKRLLGYV